MRLIAFVLCALLTAALAPAAHAEKRIALVIGNSAYKNTAELNNPKHDAMDIAAALKRMNFEVLEGRDLDKRSMERLVRQFAIKLSGADLALFFYAGHGLQVGGQNYLVPVDAKLAAEGDADFETVQLSLVLKQMEREAKTSIVLLDACRDNPLARNLARSMGTRSPVVSQGLAEVRTAVGTLIGYSTQPGNVATDGVARNSPYAEALLRHMEVPGRDVSGVLIAVRNDVLKATEGRQVPWEHTSLTGLVYLKSPHAQGATIPTSPPPSAGPSGGPDYEKEIEISFWNSVKDSNSPAFLEAYLTRYPNGSYAGLARAMIDQMKQSASATPPAVPTPDKATLVRSLQTELKRVGCFEGDVDGKWGPPVKGALIEFTQRAKVEVPTDVPTPAAADAVKGQRGRICPLECGAGRIERDGACVAKTTPERPTRAKAAGEAKQRPPAAKAGKGPGMCWHEDRRALTLVPCDDPRAGVRAY
jgi:hypothetical protein